MTDIEFYKYQGTGNDFIITTDKFFNQLPDQQTVAFLCNRRLGIGADGFIILSKQSTNDFRMIYYNSDGRESTMCGNGGRCAVAHAHYLEWVGEKCKFDAIDGDHTGYFKDGEVKISMVNPGTIEKWKNAYWIDTGSPHLVYFLDEKTPIWQYDVKKEGRKIRQENDFKPDGVNVNFVSRFENKIQMRTYERGVEDETLSCGTGNVAVACAVASLEDENGNLSYKIKNKGGELEVSFKKNKELIESVYLSGPAKKVFRGFIELP